MTTKTKMKMGLIDIPFELRELIILEVIIGSTIKAPVHASSLVDTQDSKMPGTKSSETHDNLKLYQTIDIEKDFSKRFPQRLWPSSKALKSHWQALRLVSKQLHKQVKDTIFRNFNQDPRDSSADVMFVKNAGLFATWLSATPLPTSHFDTFHTQLRIFDFPETWDPSRFNSDAWMGGCGEPMRAVWLFCHFIVGFLTSERAGPWLPSTEFATASPPHKTIEHLVVDIITSTEEDNRPLNHDSPYPSLWIDREEKLDVLSTKDESYEFAKFVKEELERILRLPYEGVRYGGVLLERIGDIEIRVDGEEFKTLSLCALVKRWRRRGWIKEMLQLPALRGKYLARKTAVLKNRRAAILNMAPPKNKEGGGSC